MIAHVSLRIDRDIRLSSRENAPKKVLCYTFPWSLQLTFSDSVTVAPCLISESCSHNNLMSTDVCMVAMSRKTVAFNLTWDIRQTFLECWHSLSDARNDWNERTIGTLEWKINFYKFPLVRSVLSASRILAPTAIFGQL